MKLFVSILILVGFFSLTFGALSYYSIATKNFDELQYLLQASDESGNMGKPEEGPLTQALTRISLQNSK